MDKQALEQRLRARSMTKAELARRIGVSRQAVSLWFKQPGSSIRVHGAQLLAVARVLGSSVERLSQPLPFREGTGSRAELQAALLWDHLYPSIDDFAVAIKQEEPPAIARLVEVYGLYAAAKLVGRTAWKAFPRYRRFIPPIRRRQLEALWAWKSNHPPN